MCDGDYSGVTWTEISSDYSSDLTEVTFKLAVKDDVSDLYLLLLPWSGHRAGPHVRWFVLIGNSRESINVKLYMVRCGNISVIL